MKQVKISPAMTHIAWALVGVIAFAVGYFAADRSGATDARSLATSPSSTLESRLLNDGDSRGKQALAGAAPEVLNSDQVRARTFEILAVPNRLERTRQFCELLARVNADNWRGIIDACNRQTVTEFRLPNPAEFELLVTRIGEVAGAAAISESLASKDPRERNNCPLLLTAWAATDGARARAWFQSQPADVQKEMLKPFLTGLSQSDPKQALALVIPETKEVQDGIIPKIVDNAVQLWGFRGAEELLTPLLGRKDIEEATGRKVFSDLAHLRIEVGKITGDPFEALNWFDKFLDNNAPGPMATTAVIFYAAQRDPSATLKWLEERTDRLNNFRGDVGYATIGRVFAQQDPGKFSAWVEANPDHPQRDRMIEAASGSLIQKGEIAEAQRLALIVRDPQIRGKIDGMLKKAREQSGPSSGR